MVLDEIRDRADAGGNLIAEHVGHHRRAAAIRSRHEVEAVLVADHFDEKFRHRSRRRNADRALAALALHPRDVVIEVLCWCAADTASALTKVAKPATGTKSLAGSNPGFFITNGRIEIVWSCEMKKVVPSGAALFSACAAICPPAPGRFSTMTEVPSSSFSFSAKVRAMASVPPPAESPPEFGRFCSVVRARHR